MHRIHAMEYQPNSTNVATVHSIEKLPRKRKLLITTKEPHRFLGKVTFGQFLYLDPGSDPQRPPSSELQQFVGVGLKVAERRSERKFIVPSPVRLPQAQLATMCLKLCEELKSGVLQFRLA